MAWMLDTNAVSDLLKGNAGIAHRLSATTTGSIVLSAVTVGELNYGLAKRPRKRALHEAVRQLLLRVQVVPWTADAAETYGRLRAALEAKGTPLSALDTLIVAHAMQLGYTLVSHDQAFKHVPGLKLEDWFE